jgi:tRNA A37 N6-isopentenylltransferase MiaA
VGMYLRGEVDLATARALIIRNSRRFVRRQYQWFHLDNTDIHWIDMDAPAPQEAARAVLLAHGLVLSGTLNHEVHQAQ